MDSYPNTATFRIFLYGDRERRQETHMGNFSHMNAKDKYMAKS